MTEHDAVSDAARLFAFICSNAQQPIRRVEVARGEVTVHAATEGDLLRWQNKEKGGFRRYPRNINEWTNADRHKFALQLRGPTRFFVQLHDEDVQCFPSRASVI